MGGEVWFTLSHPVATQPLTGGWRWNLREDRRVLQLHLPTTHPHRPPPQDVSPSICDVLRYETSCVSHSQRRSETLQPKRVMGASCWPWDELLPSFFCRLALVPGRELYFYLLRPERSGGLKCSACLVCRRVLLQPRQSSLLLLSLEKCFTRSVGE